MNEPPETDEAQLAWLKYRNKIFFHFSNVHHLVLLESEENDIEQIVFQHPHICAIRAACEHLARALLHHHQHSQEQGKVFFSQDGKPVEIETDLAESYSESALAEETAAALGSECGKGWRSPEECTELVAAREHQIAEFIKWNEGAIQRFNASDARIAALEKENALLRAQLNHAVEQEQAMRCEKNRVVEENTKLKAGLLRISVYPVHSEPMGGALDMRDIAEAALKEK